MTKIRGWLVLFIGLVTFCAFTQPAGAHVLKEDNGVSSVMHVAPYDAPVSGQSTRIEFQFGGAGTFALNNYTTQLTVLNDAKQVSQQLIMPAFLGTSTLGIAMVTFPAAGVYTLHVTGIPTTNGSPAFTLVYQVRVTSGQASQMSGMSGPEVLEIGGAVLVVFGMFSTRQIIAGKRYRK